MIITLDFDHLMMIVNDYTVLNRRNVNDGVLLIDALVDWRQRCRHRAATRRWRGVFRFRFDTCRYCTILLPVCFLVSLQIELGAEPFGTYGTCKWLFNWRWRNIIQHFT